MKVLLHDYYDYDSESPLLLVVGQLLVLSRGRKSSELAIATQLRTVERGAQLAKREAAVGAEEVRSERRIDLGLARVAFRLFL